MLQKTCVGFRRGRERARLVARVQVRQGQGCSKGRAWAIEDPFWTVLGPRPAPPAQDMGRDSQLIWAQRFSCSRAVPACSLQPAAKRAHPHPHRPFCE